MYRYLSCLGFNSRPTAERHIDAEDVIFTVHYEGETFTRKRPTDEFHTIRYSG